LLLAGGAQGEIDEKNQSNSAGSGDRAQLCRSGEGGERNMLRFGLLRFLFRVLELACAVDG